MGRRDSHLADELAAEGVDDTGDGGSLALADEVEVEHALDGLGLHAAVVVLDGMVVAGRELVRLTRRNISSWGGRECEKE